MTPNAPFSDSYTRFCDLLTLAEESFAAGDFSTSVRLAQIAARYAYPGHVGLFASPRLERLLLEIGKQIPINQTAVARHRERSSRNILHVLSYGQPIGGDSRFAWRWIQEDGSNRHCIAITSQADLNGKYDVPEVLIQSAKNTGGFLRTLDAPTSKPLEQAQELRVLCQEMDIVVLHVYPYDIIPVLALAAGCDSVKTLFMNHADHTFWIGASVAHSVVHLRQQWPDFLRNRRGLRSDPSPILPTPLAYSPPVITSAEAKRALGYKPDVVLLLTIATPFKYWAPGEITFLDLVTPALAEHPNVALIAVGPERKGAWQSASKQTNGRIAPLGRRWDTNVLYAAADVYLDSVPFSSTTSLLEAGSHGVPLLGYISSNPEMGLLGPGVPGVDNVMELANDAESYRALLTRLISDTEFRRRSGQRAQTKILSLHTGSNWIHAVRDLYEIVDRTSVRGCLLETNDTFKVSLLNWKLLHLYGRQPFGGLHTLLRRYLGSLPYRSRISVTWRLQRKGFNLCLENLLPPPVDMILRGGRRWARRIVRERLRLRREGPSKPWLNKADARCVQG